MKTYIAFVLCLIGFSTFSQGALSVTVVDKDSAAQVICGEGVSPISVGYSGADNQLGYFTGASEIFGFDSGIVIATGNVALAGTKNGGNAEQSPTDGAGIASALQSEYPTLTFTDQAELEIFFEATATEIEFKFVFASEEYTEDVGTGFNDVMGLFIQGPGFGTTIGEYVNVGKIPGTNIKIGVDSVNHIYNSAYYNNNPPSTSPYAITYDGFTTTFTITIDGLTCNENYRMNFSIADVSDANKDAAIFIGANTLISDFNVSDLIILDVGPFCEGSPISAFIDGDADWNYDWSDGQNGLGLNSTGVTADYGDTEIAVEITDAVGCSAYRTAPVVIHKLDNDPPYLLNPIDKIYKYLNDTVSYEFHSSDDPLEAVSMNIITSLPPYGYYYEDDFYEGITNPIHEDGTFIFSMSNWFQHGEWPFTIELTDQNVCGASSSEYELIVEVTCPSCPIDLYLDWKNPDHDPFYDGTIQAARNIYIGTLSTAPYQYVSNGDAIIDFVAGEEIILGPNVYLDSSEVSLTPYGGTCSDTCNQCCVEDNPITFDPPDLISIITPYDDDGINDVFYITDFSSPYDAYHATGFTFSVWEFNEAGIYTLGTKLYTTDDVSHHCFYWETPSEENPYMTFHWDGIINTNSLFWSPGDSATAGLYYYEAIIRACDGSGSLVGHDSTITGYILIAGDFKTPESYSTWLDQNMELVSQLGQSLTNERETSQTDPNFLVYPNPSSGNINIEFFGFESSFKDIVVTDMSGKEVYREQSNSSTVSMDLSYLEKGVYLIEISDLENEMVKRIVIN